MVTLSPIHRDRKKALGWNDIFYDNNEKQKQKQKYHTVGAISKFNRKIVDKNKFDTPNKHT